MAETETVDILPKNNSYLLGQEKATSSVKFC